MSAVASEPTINRAVTALGSLHRTLTYSSPADDLGSNVYAESFELYHKAVVGLRRYIDRSHDVGLAVARETTLTATLLLYCFEVLCGQDDSAMKHLEAAFAILPRSCNEAKQQDPQHFGTLALASQNQTAIDVLSQAFLRLASDWLVSGASYYGGETHPLQAVCTADIPAHFQSARDASVHLDAISSEASRYWERLYEEATRFHGTVPGSIPEHLWAHECARDCWTFAMARVLSTNHDLDFAQEVNNTIAALDRWHAAFVPLTESQPDSAALMLLEIQFWQSCMTLHALHDSKQSLSDRYEDRFERIVSVAERYLLQQPSSTKDREQNIPRLRVLSHLGNNLASCICLVVEECRNSETRRRAIDILSGLDLRGVFDTSFLVAFYRHLVSEEEMRARAVNPAAPPELKSQDIPRSARLLETCMCYCGPEEGEDIFYKKDHGLMMYVTAKEESGALELNESIFLVSRANSSSFGHVNKALPA